jgi:catechol 2,3-dioxygenase-like lactoylglutathione lyase family enzyme
MASTIHATFLRRDDADASLAFYRDALGFEVRNDVAHDGIRWITVGPAHEPGTSIVREPSDPSDPSEPSEPSAADPVGCRLLGPAVDFAPRRSS